MFESSSSLPSAFFKAAQFQPELILYSQFVRTDSHDENFDLIERTYSTVADRVRALACYLKSSGLKEGDCVGIISATRPEWLEADLAIMSAGGIVVSLYPSLIESEIAYILNDSGTKFLFVENIEQFDKIKKILEAEHSIPGSDDRAATKVKISLNKIISFEDIPLNPLTIGLKEILEAKTLLQFETTWHQLLKPESLASIVYTSGTTGPPKGVMQTHQNHLVNIRQAGQGGLYKKESAIFMLLPLAHSFSKLMGYIGFIAGVHLQFPSISDKSSSRANQRRTLLDLSQCHCSVIPLVPRVLEKMKEGLELQSTRIGIKGLMLRLTLLGASYRKSYIRRPLVILFLLTKAIRKKIKVTLFGPKFEYVISGGAKLAPEVNKFFADLKIEVLEGYGLTETCVATNCNRPGANRIGTVGPLLAPDIELKFGSEGEILFRGPNVAKGYLNQPLATAKAWDNEGWFHSGDLGTISKDGFLTITGRKKEIIVTSGGKKISPERIESLLKSHELISQAMLVGEGRPYCVAIIAANKEKLESLIPKYHASSVHDLHNNQDILHQISDHLNKINTQLASFESVKKLLLIKIDFSVENALLTPTLKMRRGPILERYRKEVEKLYQGSDKVLLE